MKKPTNYLASRTERLANYRLPFQQKLQQLQQLTKTIQQAWQPILPTELLTTLQVIDYEQQNTDGEPEVHSGLSEGRNHLP